MRLTTDNRNMHDVDTYQTARIEALKTRVDELENALRFVLNLEQGAPLPDVRNYMQLHTTQRRRRAA